MGVGRGLSVSEEGCEGCGCGRSVSGEGCRDGQVSGEYYAHPH